MTSPAETFVFVHGDRPVECFFSLIDNNVHVYPTGEWLSPVSPLGDIRWSNFDSAREWFRHNLDYVMARPSIRLDTTVTAGELFIEVQDDMPAEMPCPTCHGSYSHNAEDYPMRNVIGTFVTRGADPTTAYNLECGHSVIDL